MQAPRAGAEPLRSTRFVERRGQMKTSTILASGTMLIAVMALAGAAQAATFVYVSNAEDGDIGTYTLLPDGNLLPGARVGAGKPVMPMSVSPDRRFLYAAVRSKPFAVITYAIDPKTGALSKRSGAPLAESFPYIAVDKTGSFLLGASYGGHLVSVNAIGKDGTVSDPKQVIPTALAEAQYRERHLVARPTPHAGRQVPRRGRAHQQLARRVQGGSGHGQADVSLEHADRDSAARLRHRSQGTYHGRVRREIGNHLGLRHRPGERRPVAAAEVPNGQGLELGRNRKFRLAAERIRQAGGRPGPAKAADRRSLGSLAVPGEPRAAGQRRPPAIFRISSGVCSSASGVPGTRYLPMERPPTRTGSNPMPRMIPSARAMAFGSSPAIGTPTRPLGRWAISPTLR